MDATKMVFHHMVLIFHSFKDLDLDMQVSQIWKTSGLEDFQTTSRKSSDGVFSHVLIRWFSSSTWICFTDLSLIYMFFRSGSDYGRPMESLLGSLLKYNALDNFQEVFQTTPKKSSIRLPGSLLTGSSSISSGV
ncbi:hypothetical protein DY000_02035265 [Brassica cretica]|uniref:Anaphase-promoting complex subunit 1 n=1 Tax=Brassica cretica TaxID=69181 RepID=A0ABQ7DEM5_BRACR|nr:hypothetical protein DY000_02035265 [Brassica cretica]